MHKASVGLVENEEKRTQITNTAIVVRKLIQWLPNIISAVYAVWLVSRGVVSLAFVYGNYIIQLYPLHSWYRSIIVLSRIVRYDDCGW